MKKIILTGLLATNLYAQANEDINYRYLEIGYEYIDLENNFTPGGFYLDGAFDLSDHFYIGAHIDNQNSGNFDFDIRYDLSLGFHTNGSSNTDFYIDFRVGKHHFDNIAGIARNADGPKQGIYAGTRTAFNDRFELISKLGFTSIDNIGHIDGNNIIIYEGEVKGLFKFTNNQAITVGLEQHDDDFGAKIGYRYSF